MPVAVESCIFERLPDSNSKTGMKTSRIMWGLILEMRSTDYPKVPRLSLQ